MVTRGRRASAIRSWQAAYPSPPESKRLNDDSRWAVQQRSACLETTCRLWTTLPVAVIGFLGSGTKTESLIKEFGCRLKEAGRT